NTYSGVTNLTAGALINNGVIAGNTTVTGATAVLKGSGTFTGSVTQSAGNISPGNSVGSMHMSSLSASAGSVLFEIDGANADQINVDGDVNFTGGGINLSLLNTPTQTMYTLINAASFTNYPTLNTTSIGRTTFAPV